tara:strand:- start:217 stop:861 length:645 start_codon:yes stop_codon:yes gene_type:complete
MATLLEMRQWVSKRLQDPNNTAVSADDVDELINVALNYWKNVRFYFNEITDTTTLAQGDAAVPIPDDWLCPAIDNCFVIEYSGIRYPLRKISEDMYNAFYLSNGVGQPWYFTRQASTEYQVYPIPDRDYTLRRFYLRDYADFSADDDTNEFSEKAANLLKYTAAAYGSRDFRQDLTMYQTFMEQAKAEESSLRSITRKDNATGSTTIYSMLNTY